MDTKNKETNNIRYYWFLIRWFLIGRYHCDVSPVSKQMFFIIHKALWFFILYSIMVTTHKGFLWLASFL